MAAEPVLKELSQGDARLAVVSIDIRNGFEACRRYVLNKGIVWTYLSGDEALSEAYGNKSGLTPVFFLIDERGVVVERVDGFSSQSLRAAVAAALGDER